MLFLAFQSIYTNIALLSRKYLFTLYFYQYFPSLIITPLIGSAVAERQCRHPPLAWRQEDSRIFFTSPERSVSRVPYLAPLKKIQGRSFFAFYSSLFSQNIFTGLRHKAAQNSLFPLNFFPKGCFPFKYATDTDRLRKRVR